jgi:hypothetical protein
MWCKGKCRTVVKPPNRHNDVVQLQQSHLGVRHQNAKTLKISLSAKHVEENLHHLTISFMFLSELNQMLLSSATD